MTANDLIAEAQRHQPKLADVVAGILRTRIVEGELPDGTRLPKQDELLREFKVSRPSLREALRILEAEGLVSVQRGNVGGAIVRAPNATSSAYTFGLVLQSRHVTLGDLAEAIRSIEPVAAALCARRESRHRGVVPRLRARYDEAEAAIDEGVKFTAACRHFHEEFVRNCGNETLIVMLGTLEAMWSQQARHFAQEVSARDAYVRKSFRVECQESHRALLDAIDEGDDEQASRVAAAHLNETQMVLLAEGRNATVQAAAMNDGQGPG